MFPSFTNLDKIGVARAKIIKNEKDINLEFLYGYAYENKIKIYDGLMPRYIDAILLNIDDQHISESEDWIKKAIETHKRDGMMWYMGRDYSLHADLLKRKGDPPKARDYLHQTMEIFKECGADGWVEKYEEELASLS